MKLAPLVGLIALSTQVATARATTFEEYGRGIAARPAQQLYEASCDLDVELVGAVATVTLKQRLVNPGPSALAAVYEHELPADAVVTGFAIKATGVQTAIPVGSGYRTEHVDAAEVLGADPAVLRKVAAGRYEITVQPIAADHDLTLITRYVVTATPRAGALRLVIGGRPSAGKLAACKGVVRATPGAGASVQRIRVGRTETAGRTATFAVDAADVAIDVDLQVAGTQPIVWTQSQALADGWTATLVTALAPRVKATGARRVVFVVDGSRSMDLVGRHNVGKVVKALGSALPAAAEVEAIVFDRTATRVFGEVRPATPNNLAAIEDAIARRGAGNGTDFVQAFELARQVILGARGQAMVIVVTDGVTGDLGDQALVQALAAKTSTVDVHAIVLDPARTRSPGAKVLRAPVNLYGGAYVEVHVDELDDAMIAIDTWMRPSWLELALATPVLAGAFASDPNELPTELRGGAGFTRLLLHRPGAFALAGHAEVAFKATARPAPSPANTVAALALARTSVESFATPDPDTAALEASARTYAKAVAALPAAENDRALVVLATTGRVARSRRQMITGGGHYERMVAIDDPQRTNTPPPVATPITASAIARITLDRLFRDQLQPKAYACYQRALGTDTSLAGTAQFQLRLGRGEVTEVTVTGFADQAFRACLVDAAYQLTPPMPDFAVNADDQTIANYPLTFRRRDDRPVIVLGDADSSSPIDIDAVEGGPPPVRARKVKVETRTPLGGMRPPRSP